MPQPVNVFLQQALTAQDRHRRLPEKTLRPNAVHRLRSTTRRIEATLELLVLSADLPHRQANRNLSRDRSANCAAQPAPCAISTSTPIS